MLLVNYFILITKNILDFLSSINAFFIIISLVFIFHVLNLILRDKKYINALEEFEDPKEISIKALNYLPIVNIIIPAWKEGKEFEDLLSSIIKLNYPNIKVIVNAGGTEETIRIANSFKKHKNFLILEQKGGKSRAALGKIKALNECLNYVSKGILYFIDADCYLDDELLLRMIFPITNQNENVVIGAGNRPLKNQEHLDFVKYIHISHLSFFKRKFTRYHPRMIAGANTCITYETMKSIGKFEENRKIAEDLSRGIDILSKGYKIYQLKSYKSRIYTDYPTTFKEHFERKKRSIENILIYSYKTKNLKYIFKYAILVLVTFYLLIFPILIMINFGLFSIGFAALLHISLLKIRKLIFFNQLIGKDFKPKFKQLFFIKIILYIYIDIFNNFLIFFYLIFFKKEK